MNFRQLSKNSNHSDYFLEGSVRIKPHPWLKRSLKSLRHPSNKTTVPTGLSEGPKQVNRSRSNSVLDYMGCNRKSLVLEKQENDTFGFEIQTFGLQHRNRTAVEMCSFVCKVQEESPAQRAGLTRGDIIAMVNGVSTEGASHQVIIKLIQKSSHILRMETVSGTVMQKIELEMRLRSLKLSLREKWEELQELTLQELRLTGGNQDECFSYPSMGSPMSLASPLEMGSCHFSSVSSCWSMMTEDSEDAGHLTSVFEDQNPQHGVAVPEDNLPSRGSSWEGLWSWRGRRMSGDSQASSSDTISPSLDLLGVSMLFGTMPRRARQGHIRKRISKLLPGLTNSLEEEENS